MGLYDAWIASTGWSAIANQIVPMGLIFTASEANSTLKLEAVGNAPTLVLEYSTDGSTWTSYTVGTTLTLASVGDKVYMRCGSGGNSRFATDASNYNKFTMGGSLDCIGPLDSLLSVTHRNTDELPAYCYYGLFSGCSALATAPMLSNKALGEHCYDNMFAGCTSLERPPYLPATTLADGCYNEMFKGCSSLCTLRIAYTGDFSATYFNDWMYGVSEHGDATYHGTDTTRGASAIPVGWQGFEGVKFSAPNDSTLYLQPVGTPPTDIALDYSEDGGLHWKRYTNGNTTAISIKDTPIGKCALVKAATKTAQALSTGSSNNNLLIGGQSTSANISTSGDICYLLTYKPWTIDWTEGSTIHYYLERTFYQKEGTFKSIDFSGMKGVQSGALNYTCANANGSGTSSLETVDLSNVEWTRGMYHTFEYNTALKNVYLSRLSSGDT